MRISDWSSDVCSSDLVILIGYGRVGSLIAAELKKRGQSFVVIEYQADMARRAENDDIRVLPGNALDQRTLETAGIKEASTLLIAIRSEEHTSELQSLMRISYAVFCLKKKKLITQQNSSPTI